MAKLRRRHLDGLQAKLENIIDHIVDVRDAMTCEAEARARAERPRSGIDDALTADFERLGALLTGVRVALERMGGTTLPAFREDISSLRAQMNELQHEMVDYARAHAKTANFIEALHIKLSLDDPKPAFKAEKRRGRRDKAALDEVQQLGLMDQWRGELDQDVAEAEAKPKRGPGRPRKDKPAEDTSQKLMDEPAQEVVEE